MYYEIVNILLTMISTFRPFSLFYPIIELIPVTVTITSTLKDLGG